MTDINSPWQDPRYNITFKEAIQCKSQDKIYGTKIQWDLVVVRLTNNNHNQRVVTYLKNTYSFYIYRHNGDGTSED